MKNRKRTTSSKTRRMNHALQLKAQPRPTRHKCGCPLFVKIPGVNGLPDEELRIPDRYHRLWHRVTNQDHIYFKRNPAVKFYTRPIIPGETWPREDLPDTTLVVVTRIDKNHQTRAFYPQVKVA